ncbi:MAG: polysaccharide deacetylase [Bacteroidetes bacterium HGW-Bacteroidetes-2]|jgi:peptidoglycan/xylan/chitin deacetylase (PgdA/CDA1 family)|nr:MAG: polysaccharide deacetylase [Bacteroidetes bacterium HGW-Bacteroidetes-2]
MEKGKFIISLDFELHWGAVEKWKISERKDYFDATRKSIPQVLYLFKKYDIHATWATVGFLFAKNKEQLIAFCPTDKPNYLNKNLSYYRLLDNNEIGKNEMEDPYHYATSLIDKIISTPNQELATHTFSHYYCNEQGQTIAQFDADLKAAQSIAKENFNLILESLVFPRNQFNKDYLEVAKQNGIKVVRSNPDVWFWKTKRKLSPLARAFDTLMPISSTLTFDEKKLVTKKEILLLPTSRFLRPYTKKEKYLQPIKLNRVLQEMTYAAKNYRLYHLWWHPHNFGQNMVENISNLEVILKHFKILNEKYEFTSSSMIELT